MRIVSRLFCDEQRYLTVCTIIFKLIVARTDSSYNNV